MSRETALEFDRQLSAIPLYTNDDGELQPHPSREIFIQQWADNHGVIKNVSDEARAIGCRNCLYADRLRHPELEGHMHCARCPVVLSC